jgi:Fe-S cluster biogenesis protein NfuA
MKEDVEKLFNDMIRPYLESHGGGINLVKVESNKVYVELMGGCRGCPGARRTIQGMVEKVLQEKFPEMEVVDVTPLY